jgi:hypothetical protein
MKIKILKDCRIPDRGQVLAGEIVDVNSEHADLLVCSGFALRDVGVIETREPVLENRDPQPAEKQPRQSAPRRFAKIIP